jgi:ribosome-associated protein
MDDNVIVINERVHIPLAECAFTYSTSGGPGGQHANRSATRVMLRFDVAGSPSLPPAERERLLHALAPRLTNDGELLISVQETRSQWRNRETAVSLLQTILANALKPRKKRLKKKVSRAVKEKRLAAKKRRSLLKKDRGEKW